MKTWVKIVIVCVSGAAVWGLSYCGSIWTTYSIVFSSVASGVGMLCGILTSFSGPKS
jgi:hypothetical protein